jgi:hypothetical protein
MPLLCKFQATQLMTEYGQMVTKRKNVLVLLMLIAFENNITNCHKTGESRDSAKSSKMHQNALK